MLGVILGAPMQYVLRPVTAQDRDGDDATRQYELIGDAMLEGVPKVRGGIVDGDRGSDISVERILLV